MHMKNHRQLILNVLDDFTTSDIEYSFNMQNAGLNIVNGDINSNFVYVTKHTRNLVMDVHILGVSRL